MRWPGRTVTAVCAAALALAAASLWAADARAGGDPLTAALQVALRARGLYAGSVDGVYGPDTRAAVTAFQLRQRLQPTGELGPLTMLALGASTQATLGARALGIGSSGWDVAQLQFLLAGHGFPPGDLDGVFRSHTDAALRRFQTFAGLTPDGIAGPAVLAALQAPPPTLSGGFAWPLSAPLGDPFGPRGDRFHAGMDILAPTGTPVVAAGPGRVVYAGWRDGGFGNCVTIANGSGVRALYAHLSRVDVPLGAVVEAGTRIGLVGATGDATGPHLHFELRLRGAAVDPLAALPSPA